MRPQATERVAVREKHDRSAIRAKVQRSQTDEGGAALDRKVDSPASGARVRPGQATRKVIGQLPGLLTQLYSSAAAAVYTTRLERGP